MGILRSRSQVKSPGLPQVQNLILGSTCYNVNVPGTLKPPLELVNALAEGGILSNLLHSYGSKQHFTALNQWRK